MWAGKASRVPHKTCQGAVTVTVRFTGVNRIASLANARSVYVPGAATVTVVQSPTSSPNRASTIEQSIVRFAAAHDSRLEQQRNALRGSQSRSTIV